MYETMYHQEVRCTCDHCGKAPGVGDYYRTVDQAKSFAVAQGYYWHGWEYEGCYREVCLCPTCLGKASAPGGSSGENIGSTAIDVDGCRQVLADVIGYLSDGPCTPAQREDAVSKLRDVLESLKAVPE
jgi:hypothetical protein